MKYKFFISFLILTFLISFVFAESLGTPYEDIINVTSGEDGTFNVGIPPSINNTNNSGTTGGDTEGTTTPTAQTSGSGGGGGGARTLSSILRNVFNNEDEENKEEEKLSSKPEEDEIPEEKSSFTSLMNAAVIGVSDFVKTPAGVATFVIVGLFIVGGITFLSVKGKFKKGLPKKEEEDNILEQ